MVGSLLYYFVIRRFSGKGMHNQPVGSSTEINVGSGVDKCSRVNAGLFRRALNRMLGYINKSG